MRRFIALALAFTCVSAVPARAGGISVGAFGGGIYPVAQADAGNGTLYGLRIPVNVVPLLTIEPYWASSRLGDKQLKYGTLALPYTSKGFDETAYGASVILATGGPLSFYPFAGIGTVTLKGGGANPACTVYSGGVGLGLHVIPKLSFDVRGEAQAVACPAVTRTFEGHAITEAKKTRTFASVTAGVSYSLFRLP